MVKQCTLCCIISIVGELHYKKVAHTLSFTKRTYQSNVVLVWMVSRFMDMAMNVNVVLFTSMNMSMVYFIQSVRCMAEKIPVVGDDDLTEVEPGKNIY